MNQAAHWDSNWKKTPKIGKPNSFAVRVLPLIKKGCIVLDLCCGEGRDSLLFARHGCHVTSVDLSPVGLSKLQEQADFNNVCCRQADISKGLKFFKSSSFDVVYSHLGVHYFKDKETVRLFDEMFHILKPKGLLFIKVKSTEDALYGKGKKIEQDMYFHKHIRHFFSRDYLEHKLGRFKIIKIRKTAGVYHTYRSAYWEAIAKKP